MPSTDTEQLVVLLEARIRDFERNMAKASGTAGREFGAIERRGQQSAKRVEGLFGNVGKSINGSLRGFGGGLLAGGIAGLISEQTVWQLGAAVKSVADMADEAERIKLPVEDFQALGFVARQAGIEAGNVTDLFQKFQLAVGDAALKGNDLSKILEANGIKIRDANGKIRNQKSLFYDVVNLIKNAKGQQEAAVIAMAAFGKGAKDALPFLQQGSEAIKKGEQAARDVGSVISKELVAKAQEFDDRWTAAFDTFSAQGKTAILELLTGTDDLVSKTAEYMRMIGRPIRGAMGLPIDQEMLRKDSLSGAEQDFLDLAKKRLEIEGQIKQAKTNGAAPIEIQEYEDRLDSVLQKLEEAQRRLNALKASAGPSFETYGRGNTPAPATVIPKLSGAADSLEGAAKSLEDATKGGMLDLIGLSEGTDKGRGYNETLAYGKFSGGDQNLVNMTLREILTLQTAMLRHPENTFNSSAVGRYQITQTTLKDMIDKLGLSLDDTFGPALQDKIAGALLARRGNNPDNLRNEWEGLRGVSNGDISTALGNSSSVIESGTKAINARRVATDALTEAQRAENESLQLEARAMGLSTFEAAKLTKEHELLARAKAADIPITAELKSSISVLASEYAKGQVAIEGVRRAQEQAAQTAEQMAEAQRRSAQLSQELGQTFAGATKGFLSDLMAGKTATEALQNALANLAQQAMSMAVDGIFSQMFGGGAAKGGAGKALGGGGLGAMLGFADGGMVRGPGSGKSDSIPALLSNGEFVVHADATARHRKLLEMINSGDVPKFANGGLVGAIALPTAPRMAANVGGQVVNVSSTVTVNASGGDRSQNADLARQVSAQVEASVKQLVVKEIIKAKRPGNMLNHIGG
jgi:muramidase (phage lysozyme)